MAEPAITDIDAPHLLRDLARGEQREGNKRTAARLRTLADEMAAIIDHQTLRRADEWHEDDGSVAWWWFPICEPPYVGTPLDDGWPGDHLTYWTPLLVPPQTFWPPTPALRGPRGEVSDEH